MPHDRLPLLVRPALLPRHRRRFRARSVLARLSRADRHVVHGAGRRQPRARRSRRSDRPRTSGSAIGVIAACALAASVGSYIVFPRTFIYFGILHCIAVASVLAWPLVRRPRIALAVGIAVIVAGLALSHPAVRRARAVVDRIRDAQAGDRGLRSARAVGGRRARRHRARHALDRDGVPRRSRRSPLRRAGSVGSVATASPSTWSISRSCSARCGWWRDAKRRAANSQDPVDERHPGRENTRDRERERSERAPTDVRLCGGEAADAPARGSTPRQEA